MDSETHHNLPLIIEDCCSSAAKHVLGKDKIASAIIVYIINVPDAHLGLTWVPDTFPRFVGLRPTPKIPAARGKTPRVPRVISLKSLNRL